MSALSKIKSAKQSKPRRTVLYGVHGIGKSTWAACWPNPVFIQTEDGISDLDVMSYPLSETLADVWANVIELSGEEHPYKTVVLDSADWLERLIWKHICETKGVKAITDIEFGKGYGEASTIFAKILTAFDACRAKGMHVVILAHARTVKVEPPGQSAYTRYEPKLHKTSSNGPCASEIIQEWCDELLFANYRIDVRSEDQGFNKERGIAVGGGERLIYTQERATHVAKARMRLPAEMPLDFSQYAQFIQ